METSSFGSEFVATQQCCGYLKGLKCETRIMGMSVNNSRVIYVDNQLCGVYLCLTLC